MHEEMYDLMLDRNIKLPLINSLSGNTSFLNDKRYVMKNYNILNNIWIILLVNKKKTLLLPRIFFFSLIYYLKNHYFKNYK